MPLLTSRLLLLLAALAAGLALVVAAEPARWLSLAAAAALGGAMLLRHVSGRGMPNEDAAAEGGTPGIPQPTDLAVHYLDLVNQVARCTAKATTLHEALHAVGATMAHGLRARDLSVWRVASLSHDIAELCALSHTDETEPATRMTVRSHLSGTGLAVIQQHAVVTPSQAHSAMCAIAIPVSLAGRCVAVIEWHAVPWRSDDAALHSLLETVHLQLSLLAERDAVRSDAASLSQAGSEQGSEYFHMLVENLPASLYVFSVTDRRVLGINAYAEREFSLSRADVIGKTVTEALGRQVAALAEPAMLEALSQHSSVEHDFVLERPQGRRVVGARSFALRDAQGQPSMLIALARDITDERRAAHELQESQARLREFADAVDDSLFVTNPQRNHFQFLSTVKYDGERMTRSSFDIAPAALNAHVEPADLPLLDARRERELRLEPTDIVYRINHPRRGQRWMRYRTRSRLKPDGEILVYGLGSDVTVERERQLELQRARDAAEHASQAKSQFMASMSHEIRTPMNGILGMTELLLGTPLSDKQRRFVQAVYRSGESLLEIINDILDFSKIEAGKLELASIDFMLRGVIEDTLELLAPRAHEKGLELSFREEPGLPVVVKGDPLRLRQVLTNLVANAIKFTEQGEVVVTLGAAPGGQVGRMVFAVHDSGIGIEAEVLPRLFSAFTQASAGSSRRYGGTGLGLTISKQLVELMGGEIVVTSQPGIGSHFSFAVPFEVVEADSAALGLDLLTMPHMRILVVEDNETNRIVLDNMLHAWGMEVVLAEDGRQALDILHGRTPIDPAFDLALVDMHMPRLDGMGLALALQASGKQPKLKMVLLSSVSSPDDVRAAHQAGFHRFVPKPIRKAELRQAIMGISASIPDVTRLTARLNAHILVVEDNVVNQEVIGQMLRTLGCRVQVSTGALAGLRALCEKQFDLVLMDIQMPGMDGVEALSWFRRRTAGRFNFLTSADTPIIAVTANALGGDEERFLGLGFDDYLSKPFRQSQLLAMLTKHLRPSAPAQSGDAGASGAAALGAFSEPSGLAGAQFDSSVLDAQALERLRELDPNGENHLMERVVNAFESSVGRLMPQLQDALNSNELGGIRHVAHTLKSSSASIGAMKLSRMCSDVESRARHEQSEGMTERIAQLQAEVEIVRVALKQIVGG
ncbi:MAG: response regulator [Rhizobacter sp.]